MRLIDFILLGLHFKSCIQNVFLVPDTPSYRGNGVLYWRVYPWRDYYIANYYMIPLKKRLSFIGYLVLTQNPPITSLIGISVESNLKQSGWISIPAPL